jgi:endonuclease YncB( thermonuclease family)
LKQTTVKITCDRYVGPKIRCNAVFVFDGDEQSARSWMVLAGWQPAPPFDRCPAHNQSQALADG